MKRGKVDRSVDQKVRNAVIAICGVGCFFLLFAERPRRPVSWDWELLASRPSELGWNWDGRTLQYAFKTLTALHIGIARCEVRRAGGPKSISHFPLPSKYTCTRHLDLPVPLPDFTSFSPTPHPPRMHHSIKNSMDRKRSTLRPALSIDRRVDQGIKARLAAPG